MLGKPDEPAPYGIGTLRPRSNGTNGSAFSWSPTKLRNAMFALCGAAAVPGGLVVLAGGTFAKSLVLAWLCAVAALMQRIGSRAVDKASVLTIDRYGILDRRLMSRRIAWQEIAAVCPTDLDRAHVLDLKLRWPRETLEKSPWRVRIGAACQAGYGVPAVTISLLLLDGRVVDVLQAIAHYRPDLLNASNR